MPNSFLPMIQMQFYGEKITFSTNGAEINGHSQAKLKMSLHVNLTPYTKKKKLKMNHRLKYKICNYKIFKKLKSFK